MLVLAAMDFFGLTSVDATPTKNVRTPDEDDKAYCSRVLLQFVDELLIPPDISGEEVLLCPLCQKAYKERKSLRRHVEATHKGDNVSSPTDGIFNYSCQVLCMCFIAYEFTNARKLGDGERIMMLVKYMMLYFKALGKKKYAYQCLRLLAQVNCFLTPREAANIVWNRFSNTRGKRDSNVELDRECEHSNLNFKIFARGLHGQVTQQTVDRVSRSCQPIAQALLHVDEESDQRVFLKQRQEPDHMDDVTKLVEQLQGEHLFEYTEGRYHKCFPGFTVGLKVNHESLFEWMSSSLENMSRLHQFSFKH